jgi:hypothetical protein
MRDPYSVPACGPKRLTASRGFDQPASVLLQLAARAIQKMRRTDTGRAVWTLDTDYGSDGGSLWLNAIAAVPCPFRLKRMADVGPLQTTVSMTCAVTWFRKNDRSLATYAVDFMENNYHFMVTEARVRFQVWSRGFTSDFDGSVARNVLETEGVRGGDNIRGQAFWQLIGGGE